MSKVQRSRDIVEMIAEKVIFFAIGGFVLVAVGGVLYKFRGEGMFVTLAMLLMTFGIGLVVASVVSVLQVKKVTEVTLVCPYCEGINELLELPNEDFDCVHCHRMVPVCDQQIMAVSQVRCGFCGELNFYCEKTELLICEKCDHEIPIAQEEGKPMKTLPKGFAVLEDDSLYELVLTGFGLKQEEVITTLQQMLALNRNQVKEMLDHLPSPLLTGINRRKAEMLQAQLSLHGAVADIKVLTV